MDDRERVIAAAMMHALDGLELPPVAAGMDCWKAEIDWAGVLGDPKDGDLMLSGPGARTVGIHFEIRITSDDHPELPIP